MIMLTNEEIKSYEKQEVCHICKKKFYNDDDKKYQKVRDHCHHTGKFIGAAHNNCNLNCKVLKKIPVVIHNAGYDTYFIIKQLAEEFGGHFDCIGEILFQCQLKKKKNLMIVKQLQLHPD